MRTSALLPLAITFTLTGCSGGTTYGLWVISSGTPATSGSTSCDENYDNARCVDNGSGGNSKWTIEDNAQESDALQFVEILEGTGDGAFIVADGKVYPGTLDKDTFTFEWKSTTKSLHSEDYEGDYEFIVDENSVINTKYTFTLGKDPGTLSGKLTQTVTSTYNVKETDQPNNDDILGVVGQINEDAFNFLENTADIDEADGRYNSADLEECQARDCEIAVVENTTTTWDLSGNFATDQSIGTIGDYQDVVQTPGADAGDVL